MLYCPCRCSICTASLSLFVFLPCLLKIYLIILATPSKVQLRIGRKCALACLSFGSRRHRGTKENRRCLANTTRRIFDKYFRHWFAFWLFMSYLCTGKGSTQVFPFLFPSLLSSGKGPEQAIHRGWMSLQVGPNQLSSVPVWHAHSGSATSEKQEVWLFGTHKQQHYTFEEENYVRLFRFLSKRLLIFPIITDRTGISCL